MRITIKDELRSIIPPLTNEERSMLKDSIMKEGCRDALIVWENGEEIIIVDGHNRFEICNELDVEYSLSYSKFDSMQDVKAWMIQNQFSRRNLTAYQRSVLALQLEEIYRSKAKENLSKTGGDKKSGLQNSAKPIIDKIDTRSELAKIAGVSHDTIAKVKKIEEKGSDELKQGLFSGNISINEAFKEIKKEERRADIDRQKDDIRSGKIQMPVGVFETIVIDPPWNYGREYDPDGSRVANPYPEMNQEELKGLEIPSADDCIMWLWTTHAFMMDARELLSFWGFEYKATMVWDKDKIGMGSWLRMQCEFCLLGIKGKPLWDTHNVRDIIREPRREHSRKPESFYEMIDDNFVGRKLDYFSRSSRPGWTVMGNDINKF